MMKDLNIPATHSGTLSFLYEFLSRMMTEAFAVLDFQRKNFSYISNHALSLCGYTQEAIKALGFDFFKKAIHPEDLPFWVEVYHTVLESLNNDENDELDADEVNYFSFLIRVKNAFSLKEQSDYLRTYVKLFPLWTNGQFQYGICVLSPSVMQRQNNRLSVHYYNMDHADYSFKKKNGYVTLFPL